MCGPATSLTRRYWTPSPHGLRPPGGARVSAGLRICQVVEAAGVNIQTLRYYERRSLLPEPERSLGGHGRPPAARRPHSA
ncbi:MerR family DNA-binding transcriptional regulator [Streptomyces sp. NPDC048479]|uniref:MerR family DNA-binding transcriptional regulator n=1 Tax=Streptomyces sp. NPDC048479 TaxID=3154725 RepID=UPI00344ACF38